MARQTVRLTHTLTAATATEVSAEFVPDGALLGIAVDITAIGGTPTLDIEVEWSPDGTNWGSAETPDTFTQITAVGVVAKQFTVKGPKYRLNMVIGGTTPSFTGIIHTIELD